MYYLASGQAAVMPKGVNAQGATSDKIVACRVASKLSFRKINGNRRKCAHRTRATSGKILNFYNFMRALLRQATILSLVARVVACPVR